MSSEFVPESLHHKDIRHIQVRLDYMLLYRNETKAKIISIVESWTDTKRKGWYKESLDRKEQGLAPPEEELWVTMSYGQFSIFAYGTVKHDNIKQCVDDLVADKHLFRRVHPTEPYGSPQYLLNTTLLQKLLDEQEMPSLSEGIGKIEPLRKKHTPQEKYPQGRGTETPRVGVKIPPARGENTPPSNNTTKNHLEYTKRDSLGVSTDVPTPPSVSSESKPINLNRWKEESDKHKAIQPQSVTPVTSYSQLGATQPCSDTQVTDATLEHDDEDTVKAPAIRLPAGSQLTTRNDQQERDTRHVSDHSPSNPDVLPGEFPGSAHDGLSASEQGRRLPHEPGSNGDIGATTYSQGLTHDDHAPSPASDLPHRNGVLPGPHGDVPALRDGSGNLGRLPGQAQSTQTGEATIPDVPTPQERQAVPQVDDTLALSVEAPLPGSAGLVQEPVLPPQTRLSLTASPAPSHVALTGTDRPSDQQGGTSETPEAWEAAQKAFLEDLRVAWNALSRTEKQHRGGRWDTYKKQQWDAWKVANPKPKDEALDTACREIYRKLTTEWRGYEWNEGAAIINEHTFVRNFVLKYRHEYPDTTSLFQRIYTHLVTYHIKWSSISYCTQVSASVIYHEAPGVMQLWKNPPRPNGKPLQNGTAKITPIRDMPTFTATDYENLKRTPV